MDRLFQKLRDFESSPLLIRYEKEFAERLTRGLAQDYVKGEDEPAQVATIENVVNNLDDEL